MNEKLRTGLEDRVKLINRINSLLFDKKELEQFIKKDLIDHDMADMLSVDWAKLHRIQGLPSVSRMAEELSK